jgi:HSP20 family protein
MNANMVKKDGTSAGSNLMTRPFGSLLSNLMGSDVSRWFDDEDWGLSSRVSQANVPVNIRETDKTYELEVMAPGLKKSDFKVSVDGKQLSISFEQNDEKKEGDEKTGYIRQEYRHRSFSRTFTLDDTVDANKISADYTDGVLHLCVPKKEEAQRIVRSVEVK